MTNHDDEGLAEDEIGAPAVERWFSVLLAGLVPLVAALFVPQEWRTPLHVAGGALCITGLVMLARHR